ncbi:glutamate racemase [Pseudocolwellia sp. AS88]|uniref:glutamate racemase n=1 Tax=Pseudocolwellia sp. AS88 TaxID=3063958 RepID=UPI0026EE6B2A|nr:glutamate racemase [Pseudocolwellia sp. AS88]MDO7086748.1 glutamate racemase [Pseudocolwellia sp. AS88]
MAVTQKPLHKHMQNEAQTTQAIGIFDSGVGGLSIFNCIKEQLPEETLIYVADSLYAPYGDKSDEEIIARVNIIADQLISQNCKALVIACNTATVIAIDQLRKRLSIPIIGVEPAIKPAVIKSKNKRVGILTTQATAKNQRFLDLVEKYKNNSQVYIQPCPGLVELIESNQLHSTTFDNLLKSYLELITDKKIDTLVLGCTHYPFFSDKLKDFLSSDIAIMETALPVTEQLKRQLIQHELMNQTTELTQTSKGQPQYQFFSSQANNALSNVISALLNKSINLFPFAD